jgi:hypothetical protein
MLTFAKLAVKVHLYWQTFLAKTTVIMSPILSSATLAGMTHIGTILCRVAYGGQGKKVGVIATQSY